MAIEPDALGKYPCPKCGVSYMQEYSAQTCCAATFVQDVLNAPTAEEPDPTPEADALQAYNASSHAASILAGSIDVPDANQISWSAPTTDHNELAMGYYTAYG